MSNISLKLNIRIYLLLGLVFFYLAVRFIFTKELDSMGAYSSYIFEVFNVLVAVLLAEKYFTHFFKLNKRSVQFSLGSLFFGFLIFQSASFFKIQFPFDFTQFEMILFLLVVAPLLEEFIFRFFLWYPFEKLFTSSVIPWILTTLLFSYSHLHAIWFVPAEFHNFIIYQTIYTLFLGAFCGYFVFRYKSLLGAILTHFTFNLGFYLGSLFLSV
ncbi:MAG TPA: CPBP family intramembrane metalloprotease [Pseudobdellovibrionaceae bacterium]|nr:CPBP family intramembrane metalloprotease [Pseudobdellovibrionaceae bacterium]